MKRCVRVSRLEICQGLANWISRNGKILFVQKTLVFVLLRTAKEPLRELLAEAIVVSEATFLENMKRDPGVLKDKIDKV